MSVLFNDLRSKKLIVALFLVLGALVVYRPIKDCWFVDYDDDLYVTENLRVQEGLNWKNVGWAFTTFDAANWHPLTWLSHMADCQLYGLNATGHHFMNLTFHLANIVILFLLLHYLTGALWRSATVAALFGLHPLNVQSVAWIAERKNLLSTLFWLLTMWAYAWYVRKGGWQRYLIVMCAFALGSMAKPMLVTLPFVLLLMDYWPLDRFAQQAEPESPTPADDNQMTGQSLAKTEMARTFISRLFWLTVEKLPLFLLSFVSSFLTYRAQSSSTALMAGDLLPLGVRISNAIYSYGRYLGKTFYPKGLAIFYPYPNGVLISHFVAIVVILVCVTAFAFLTKKRYITFGWFWFVGTLVPVIGLVQAGGQAMADRYAYVPLIGFFVMLVWLAHDLSRKFLAGRQITLWAGFCILLVLSLVTRRQLSYWKDSHSLMSHAIYVTENNYIAYNNLGRTYMSIGDAPRAFEYFQQSIKSSPGFILAYFNSGASLMALGRDEEAARYFQHVIEKGGWDKQNISRSYVSLAALAEKRGQNEEAEKHYLSAVENSPGDPNSYYAYSKYLSRQGRQDEALIQINKSIKLAPYPRSYYQLGQILEAENKEQEAAAAYEKVLKLNPDDEAAKEKLNRITNKNTTGAG